MSNAVASIRECGSCGNYLQRIFTGKLHPDPGSVAQTCLRTCAKKKQMLNLPSYIFDKCFTRLVVVSAQLLRHICCQGGRQKNPSSNSGSLLLQLSNMRCSCHSSLRNTIPTEYILCKLMEKPGKALQGFQLLRDCRLPGIRCTLILSMCIYLKDIMEKHHTIFLSNKKKTVWFTFSNPLNSKQNQIFFVWDLLLCNFIALVDVKVFPQLVQGICIFSR